MAMLGGVLPHDHELIGASECEARSEAPGVLAVGHVHISGSTADAFDRRGCDAARNPVVASSSLFFVWPN